MAKRRSNPEYLNGIPELLILKLLTRQPMYGYELVEAIRSQSGEVFEFGEGSIYPILHRLESEGMLASRRENVNQRNRVVYRTTASGTRRLSEATARWTIVADTVRSMLEGGGHAEPALL